MLLTALLLSLGGHLGATTPCVSGMAPMPLVDFVGPSTLMSRRRTAVPAGGPARIRGFVSKGQPCSPAAGNMLEFARTNRATSPSTLDANNLDHVRHRPPTQCIMHLMGTASPS